MTATLVLFLVCACAAKKSSSKHKSWEEVLDSANEAYFAGQHEQAAQRACRALVMHRASPQRGDLCLTGQIFFELLAVALSHDYAAAARAWKHCRKAGMAENLYDGAVELAEWLVPFAEKNQRWCGPMAWSGVAAIQQLAERGPAGRLDALKKYAQMAEKKFADAGIDLLNPSDTGTFTDDLKITFLKKARTTTIEANLVWSSIMHMKHETEENRKAVIKWRRAQAAAVCPDNPKSCSKLKAELALMGEQFDVSKPVQLTPDDPHYRIMVAQEFDDFARTYDSSRVSVKAVEGYYAHTRSVVAEAVKRYHPRSFAVALDVGVGTGLAGEIVQPHLDAGGKLIGVDLSEKMLAKAKAKKIYSEVHHAEALAWLRDTFLPSGRRADLAIAIELCIYLGPVEPFFRLVHASLVPGGLFIASFESLEDVFAKGGTVSDADMERGYVARPSGRWAHALSYLKAAADVAGLEVLASHEDVVLRFEWGDPEKGHFILCRRKEDEGTAMHVGSKGAKDGGSAEGRGKTATSSAREADGGACACSDFNSGKSDAATVEACEAAGDGKSCTWVGGYLYGGSCTGAYSCGPQRNAEASRVEPAGTSVCATVDECARRATDMMKKQAADQALQDTTPLALYARALTLDPSKASLHNDYAVALGHHGRWAEAVERFRAALALREEERARLLAKGGGSDGRLERKMERVRQNLEHAQRAVQAGAEL